MEFYNAPLITILGPTASGKTRLAVDLAKLLGGEIISADSRQVYREMDIGTGKDLQVYGDVPYHLISMRYAGDSYDVASFQKDFHSALNSIHSPGNFAILCGGSGIYIQAVLQDFNHTSIPKNTEPRSALEGLTLEELSIIFQSMPTSKAFKADCG